MFKVARCVLGPWLAPLALCATQQTPDQGVGKQGLFGPDIVVSESRLDPVLSGITSPNVVRFGRAVAVLGDLNGDGFGDLAVGRTGPDAAGYNVGAVHVLFLDAQGDVASQQEISAGSGGLVGPIGRHDNFGGGLALIGDLDGDGLDELAVGAPTKFGKDCHGGAVWILFLNPDGTVRAERKIASGVGGFPDILECNAFFGGTLACIGDLDGDGLDELAVGAPGQGGLGGRAYVLFLNADGVVRQHREISRLVPSGIADLFGTALAPLGDLDGDAIPDLAVGAQGGNLANTGDVVVFLLNSDASVKTGHRISADLGGFGTGLDLYDGFGSSLANMGDLDGDGVVDLAVGARYDDDGGSTQFTTPGAVWILFLTPNGNVRAKKKISAISGGFGGTLDDYDGFGGSMANPGDLDGDGLDELWVGTSGGAGALWRLTLDGIARAGFEAGDDYCRTALANGQSLLAGGFGRTLEITATGPNLGAAIFDSTPLGPNDPGEDPDLLVGRGNVLILQSPDASAQSTPGVFDVPDDAPGGGTMTIGFRGPVEPRSIDLVDIDIAGSVKLLLVDRRGRLRGYDVPNGWTRDLLEDGPPAVRTLDLTTLQPQQGFAASALAFEQRGFEGASVVSLHLVFSRWGAIDDLCWRPHPRTPRRFR